MRPSLSLASLAAAFVVALPATSLAAEPPDHSLGTWALNLAKSQLGAGTAHRSTTRTYVQEADGAIRMYGETITTEGQQRRIGYVAKYDGQDYPIRGNPNVDTVALKRIDEWTTEVTEKRAGQIVNTVKRVVSKDGKTMTVTIHGKDENGKPTTNTYIFDKLT